MTQDTKRTMADFDFEKVHAAHQRLVNSHFRQEPSARMQIPANPNDDDIYVSDFIFAAERQAAELAALRDWRNKAKEVIGLLNAEMPYYRLVCLEDCQSKQGGICDCGAASLRAIAESVDALLA